MEYSKILSAQFNLREDHTANIINLIDEGNTLPFIARYRKELTGAIDDQLLRELAERLEYLRNLEKRKAEITASIEEQGKMTDEIRAALEAADTLAKAEDIYRPFKKKRQTRASIARDRGLAPLAELIWNGGEGDVYELAASLTDEEKGVADPDAAIAGALDIIAEDVSDDAALRDILRRLLSGCAVLHSVAKAGGDSVYSLYYDFSEAASKIPSHRILAINRGESEDFLKVDVDFDRQLLQTALYNFIELPSKQHKALVMQAADDSFTRLIMPSLERELRNDLTERANAAAIKNFGTNLKPLLMQPPLKGSTVIGLDPGFRTGCKVAVVDAASKVLATDVFYVTHSQAQKDQAAEKLRAMIKKYGATAIAIGNGTASRETEAFAAEAIKDLPCVAYTIVNESGASVYSASKLAAKEFPDFDVTLRSAVSIARRLQDPLAELVKIEPKAIGVGQYQHDMPKNQLESALSGVVEDCVNSVGVDLNTASPSLLSYVAGVSNSLADSIVSYREENGAFSDRKQLLKVPKLGKKAYEQCAGFLRIKNGKNSLDNTGVHPESYDAASKLLSILEVSPAGINEFEGAYKNKQVALPELAKLLQIGELTLTDIVKELSKPGRDPRDELPPVVLRKDVLSLDDLKPGMELSGTVRNVIDFGAFVDIGVHEDGLVHISQITDRYIKHPSDVLKVGDIVKVRVISVDTVKKRISLTMK